MVALDQGEHITSWCNWQARSTGLITGLSIGAAAFGLLGGVIGGALKSNVGLILGIVFGLLSAVCAIVVMLQAGAFENDIKGCVVTNKRVLLVVGKKAFPLVSGR